MSLTFERDSWKKTEIQNRICRFMSEKYFRLLGKLQTYFVSRPVIDYKCSVVQRAKGETGNGEETFQTFLINSV